MHIDFYIQIQIMQKIVLFDIDPENARGYYKHSEQYAFFADLLSTLSIFFFTLNTWATDTRALQNQWWLEVSCLPTLILYIRETTNLNDIGSCF